jgi:hypothetical protein
VKIRLALTLRIERGKAPETPDRETQLDALVERGDPHPEIDRPIGFRREE